MPIGILAQGTKENIRCRVDDASELVSDLSTSGPTFTVRDSADVAKVTDASATASGMIITVPLDTTVGGTWAEGEYRLFVKYTVGSEVIRKGPHYFTIANF
jgi:hypothetical protein